MNTSKIYVLIDPRDGEIRYVGRTVQSLEQRLLQHIQKSTKKSHRRAVWIRDLQANGLVPSIEEVESVSIEDSPEKEKHWTRKLLAEGRQLLNDGIGRGGCNHPKKKITWTPELDALLGTMADAKIAERLGVTRKSVSYRREKLGIPASYDRERNTPPPPMGGHNKVELTSDILDLLGTIPDYKLAKKAGVSKKVILSRRQELGIPSYAESTGKDGKYEKGHYPQRWIKRQV